MIKKVKEFVRINQHNGFYEMRLVLFTACILWMQSSLGAENLNLQDLYGKWISDKTVVAGESQELILSEGNTAVFKRKFETSKEQSFRLDRYNFFVLGDLIILDFHISKEDYSYKLVLSGWKSGSMKKLYGMMFMYRNGVQFNGLQVSFIPG